MRIRRAQQHAKALRLNMTDAEQHLWQRLRVRQLGGCKFRRQVPIGSYIADFACLEARLVIELDGGQHNLQSTRDATRDAELRALGFRVLRFWNHAVFTETEQVLEVILAALSTTPPSQPSPAGGGRSTESSR